MYVVYDNTKIFYYITSLENNNQNKTNLDNEKLEKNNTNENEKGAKNTEFIVFLHGWGAGSEVLVPLARMFAKSSREKKVSYQKTPLEHRKYRGIKRRQGTKKSGQVLGIEKADFEKVLKFRDNVDTEQKFVFIDFPPFGRSGEPTKSWGIEDYTKAVLQVLEAENIKKIKIIAHSFGGRVAILLSSVYNIADEMILIGGAGLKMKKSLGVRLKIAVYKICKRFGFRPKNAGSHEYRQLSPVMKETFVRVVNSNLEQQAKQISCPVTLIYGENDKATPPELALRLHNLLQNSVLYLVKDAGHFVWLR